MKGPMVLATLDGRKTQTRRVVKFPLVERNHTGCEIAGCEINSVMRDPCHSYLCPYGKRGDHLWVKETWIGSQTSIMGYFRADLQYWNHATNKPSPDCGQPELCKWKPSIFMPRWRSRLTLEVLSVRAERLQDITESDCIAEGAMYHDGGHIGHSGYRYDYSSPVYTSAINAYAHLWESINGEGSWALNSWVWVIDFKRI